jgi:hypothetical protein
MGSGWLWAAAAGFAVLTAWLARRRGADPVRWGALGFFFGPLPLPLLLWRHRRRG